MQAMTYERLRTGERFLRGWHGEGEAFVKRDASFAIREGTDQSVFLSGGDSVRRLPEAGA